MAMDGPVAMALLAEIIGNESKCKLMRYHGRL